jgi:hypothetical protein
VLFLGGGGSLLLKDRHPANASGNNRAIKARRMGFFLLWRGLNIKLPSDYSVQLFLYGNKYWCGLFASLPADGHQNRAVTCGGICALANGMTMSHAVRPTAKRPASA